MPPHRTFREAVQERDFVLTAELELNRESSAGSIVQQAEVLAPHIDAVQVPDSPNARVQVSPMAACGVLLKHGIEPIAHVNCRDRNRVALESELLGLGLTGVSSLLLMRGDDLPDDHRPKVRQVFELRGRELIESARSLADDPASPSAPDFFIGTVATVFNPKAGWVPKSLLAKAEAGAQFIQTQLCFDTKTLHRYMQHLVEARLTWKVAVIVSVATLPSAVSAKWLSENQRGSLVPKKIIRRLKQARDPEQEGVAICAELLEKLKEIPGISGAHLVSPGDAGTVPAAIEAAGLGRAR